MYPSKIMTDNSLNGIPLNTVAEIINIQKNNNIPNFLKTDEDTIQTHNAGETIMQNILNLNAKFLQMEDLYNVDNTYNFGFLPYYLAQKLVPICKNSTNLSEAIDTLITEYIINTTNYRYTLADIHKVKLLILHILTILSKKQILFSTDIQLRALDTTIKYNTIIQTVYDTFSYIRNDKFTAETLINKVIKQATKTLNTNQTLGDMLFALPDEVKLYVVNMWCYLNHISADNIDQYKQTLKSYYDFARYVVQVESPINVLLDANNKMIDHEFDFIFTELEKEFKANCNFAIPDNSAEELTKLMNQSSESVVGLSYKIYIYTSFLMYNPTTMIIPAINDYDSGNGGDDMHLRADCKSATAELLISKVYEDISNYYIFGYYNYNTIEYNQEIYKNWINIKSFADNHTIAYTDKLVVLHTAKFLTMLINKICPSTFHPSKYTTESNKHSYCHFIKDKGWLNLYNIFNIDASYIIVKSTKKFAYNTTSLVDWAQNIQVIFRPLKNLSNYYYKIDNPNDYMKYMITYSTELMARPETEDIKENNHETGREGNASHFLRTKGSLYSIFDGSFYLIDSKKYNISAYIDEDINDTYLKTLVQCWMYINMYYHPLCTLSDNSNRVVNLYKQLYVVAVNPLHGHIVISPYKNIDKIITPDIHARYKFA